MAGPVMVQHILHQQAVRLHWGKPQFMITWLGFSEEVHLCCAKVYQTRTTLSWEKLLPQSDSGTYSQSLVITDHYCIFMVSIDIFNLWTSDYNDLWDHQNVIQMSTVGMWLKSPWLCSVILHVTLNRGATELSKTSIKALQKILAW